MNKETKFILAAFNAVVFLVSYILLTFSTGVALNGIIYIIPCFIESIGALAKKEELPTKMLIVNLIAVVASVIIIVLCVITLMTNYDYTIIIRWLLIVYFIKCTIVAIYYWKKA